MAWKWIYTCSWCWEGLRPGWLCEFKLQLSMFISGTPLLYTTKTWTICVPFAHRFGDSMMLYLLQGCDVWNTPTQPAAIICEPYAGCKFQHFSLAIKGFWSTSKNTTYESPHVTSYIDKCGLCRCHKWYNISTDFSFQNLVLWNLFEFSVAEII
jgi:hypothetical protein